MVKKVKNLKKYSMWLVPFLLLLVLIIVYKSLDNLAVIKGYLSDLTAIIRPFLIGFLIAYIFNLPCKKIQALLNKSKYGFLKKRSKGLSIFLVYLIAFLIIFIAMRALIPAIYKNALDLYNNAPYYIEKMISILEQWQQRLNLKIFSADSKITFEKALEDFIKSINLTEFSKYAQGVINLTSGVINAFISIIVSVYMLIDKELIKKRLKTVFSILSSEEKTRKLGSYFARVNDIFSKYIYCRVIDGLIIAVIATLILTILKVKYALILGILIGLCNLIPYFGSIIGTVITMVITLVTNGIFTTLWAGVLLIVLEQIDGNYIGPKIMGEVLEIRPLWVIFAVTVGGGLFGVIGMLFSVPILVIIKMVSEDYIKTKQTQKGILE